MHHPSTKIADSAGLMKQHPHICLFQRTPMTDFVWDLYLFWDPTLSPHCKTINLIQLLLKQNKADKKASLFSDTDRTPRPPPNNKICNKADR